MEKTGDFSNLLSKLKKEVKTELSEEDQKKKNEQAAFNAKAKVQRHAYYLQLDTWRSACLKAKFSSIQLAVSDPTGLSALLKKYKLFSCNPGAFLDALKALKAIEGQVEKLTKGSYSSYASSTDSAKQGFSKYLKQVAEAADATFGAVRLLGLRYMLEGQAPGALSEFKIHMKKELNLGELQFIIDIMALEKNLSKGYNYVVDEQSRIMDEYGIFDIQQKYSIGSSGGNSGGNDVNLSGTLKRNWVEAFQKTKDNQTLEKSLEYMHQAKEVCYTSLYNQGYERFLKEKVG